MNSILKSSANYDYLIKMPIYNLTHERIEELKKELNQIESEYNSLKNKSNKDIWLDELNVFQKEYKSYLMNIISI